MIRPSSLPMLAQCSAFESGTASEYADEGTKRHAALRAHYNGDDTLLDALDDESQEAVKWAAEYIRLHAPSDMPCVWETKRNWVRPDFSNGSGTPDCVCSNHLFDFKWRRRDYSAQLADYSLAMFEILPVGYTVHVHILFGADQWAERYDIDRESAERIVAEVLTKCEAPTPTPCDYCGWCAKKLTCQALVRPALRIAKEYTDGELNLLNWHPSKMESAEEIDTALIVARSVAKWCESVEFHAKEAATKKGLALPHFKVQERAGRAHITDTLAAYQAIGLPAEAFLATCEPRMNTSKDKTRLGLVDVYAKAKELKKAPAEREVKAKLGDLLQRGKPTISLVSKDENPF